VKILLLGTDLSQGTDGRTDRGTVKNYEVNNRLLPFNDHVIKKLKSELSGGFDLLS
jgi:hypothetical protein